MDGYKRLKLGEKLNEWLVNTRERLFQRVFNLLLKEAEARALKGDFDDAVALARQPYDEGTQVAYPSPTQYRRLHTLLLAAARLGEAERLQREARELYGPDIVFEAHKLHARQRLTHTYNLRPENPDWVGREAELGRVLELLSARRLVTLTGMPGVGKTELAMQAARAARGRAFSRDGVHTAWLEELPPHVETPRLLTALADALGLKGERASAVDDVVAAVGDGHTLLVLDNFEGLIDPHAPLVALLHRRCPNLRLLVTSREVLRLEHETPVRLAGLPYPNADEEDAPEEGRYAAVELFERAARGQGVVLRDADLPGVARVCQSVEGLPLAIKLAAAWVSILSPAEIADRLRERLDLLSRGARDAPRHGSVHAAFGAAVELLSLRERRALVDLTVFEGGWTLGAASAVAGVELDLLRSLTEKSLLRYDRDAARYSFHPLLKRFAAAQAEGGNRDALERRHAEHFLAADYGPSATDTLLAERHNLEAALRHADDARLDALYAAGAAVMSDVWDLTGQYAAAEAHLKRAGERAKARGDLTGWLRTLAAYGRVADRLGKTDEGIAALEAGLHAARSTPSGEEPHLAALLYYLAGLNINKGDYPQARAYLDSGLEHARALCLDYDLCRLLNARGVLEKHTGSVASALALFEEAQRYAEKLRHRPFLAVVYQNLGATELDRDNLQEAVSHLNRGLEHARTLGFRHTINHLLQNLGLAEKSLGNLEKAEAYLLEGLESSRRLGYQEAVSNFLADLGELYVEGARLEEAQACLDEAETLAVDLDNPWVECAALTGRARLEEGRERWRAALENADRALSVAKQHNFKDPEGSALFIRARALYALGDTAAALRAAEESLERFLEFGHKEAQTVEAWLGRAAAPHSG